MLEVLCLNCLGHLHQMQECFALAACKPKQTVVYFISAEICGHQILNIA